MSKAVVAVEGARAFRASLRRAGDNLTDLKIVHGQVADVAAGGARREVPTLTGRLKATIRASGTKTAAIVRVGNNRTVPYALPIHWGWKKRNIKPNPFAAEGATDTSDQWVGVYENYVEAQLSNIKGK